ncbi:hypothetical protein L1049_026347 [Liquidambar formosana]|uniref:Uncharacterized protein n=1 Tax=Liquidambar formosana TaxID=63359 RepID=A0AAP0R786_LIQFO
MAGNEWINGYLEAILDAGSSTRKKNANAGNKLKTARFEVEDPKDMQLHNSFNPTKYFVEEVVNGFDESDLHRTWIKVSYSLSLSLSLSLS